MKRVAAAGGRGEDRAEILYAPDHLLVIVADGAGGSAGGAEAADGLVRDARLRRADPFDPATWSRWLREVDAALREDPDCGETTAVIAAVRPGLVVGASVGDSGAWLVGRDGFRDLTLSQHRKPLLGSGDSAPVTFEVKDAAGTLLVATDGLLKYAPPRDLCELARLPDLGAAAAALVEAVHLPGGTFHDDVAFVLCRL